MFAASIGINFGRRVPLGEIAQDFSPIPRELFARKGYDFIINLIAITDTRDPEILSDGQTIEEQRMQIFEEYVNGGLEILQCELRDCEPVDYLLQLSLLLLNERPSEPELDQILP